MPGRRCLPGTSVPGQLLCTYIRILWLKRCFRYEAGHPSTVTSETVTPSVDMALDGERDPVRRPAARVRASVSVSRTSPLNKGKTSPSKVAKRRPIIKEPPPVPQRQEPVVDRRGNLHDPNTGNFIGRTAKGAADLSPAGERAVFPRDAYFFPFHCFVLQHCDRRH